MLLLNLGLVICAAGIWASTGLDTRPNNSHEQILVSGAIWTQILLPIGLIISAIVDEKLDIFVHLYYLLAGCVVLVLPGLLLIIGELRKLEETNSQDRSLSTIHPAALLLKPFDKIYFSIGVLLLLASVITFVDLILVIF
ncbi:uncharacterized protein LOC112045143 [Bicyclus anynana]|uniref:Uncharacterized protein LOC112045143 n=1 Tax=Bicyclus anynana TaxID=110368 RepID=A0A6J1MR86_BICAN|nr:uncharacterized protein LOC112045143 [Bicyclus anynana]